MDDTIDRPQTQRPRSPGLTGALRDFADGVTDLIRYQTELIRIEARQEVTEAGARSGRLLAMAGAVLVGYVLLNFGVVLLVGAFTNTLGMALTMLGLAVAHIGVGAWRAWAEVQGFERQGERLKSKTKRLTAEEGWQIEGPDTDSAMMETTDNREET